MKKIFFAILFFSSISLAFVTPPGHFFQAWVVQNKPLQSILIKQERDILQQGATVQTVLETIKIKRSGLFKWTSNINGQEEVKILGKTKALIGSGTSLRQVKLQDVITPLEVSLIYSQTGNIESVLNQIGIDVNQSGLELIEKEPRVRIGMKNGNRLYVSSSNNLIDSMFYMGRLYKFKYDPKGSLPSYPSHIEIYEGDLLKEKIRIVTVLTTPKFTDKEFES